MQIIKVYRVKRASPHMHIAVQICIVNTYCFTRVWMQVRVY